MPSTSLPGIEWDKAAAGIGEALKEAAYVAVGLGVLSFQRAQVRRVEMAKQFSKLAKDAPVQSVPSLDVLLSQLGGVAKIVDAAVAPARKQADERLDRIEEALPEAARKTVKTVRATALSQEQAIRSALGIS